MKNEEEIQKELAETEIMGDNPKQAIERLEVCVSEDT